MSTTTIRGAPSVSFLGFIKIWWSRLLPPRYYNFGITSVQLRERKDGFLAPKRHQMKHLDFLILLFLTRRSMVQIHSPRPLPNSCLSLAYATFSVFVLATFCGPMWTNSKPRPMRSAHSCRNATSSLSFE
jgi:hypothetical protein